MSIAIDGSGGGESRSVNFRMQTDEPAPAHESVDLMGIVSWWGEESIQRTPLKISALEGYKP